MKMMDTSLFPATSVFSHNEARSADPAPHVSIVHSDNPYRTALATYLRSNGFVVDEFDEPAVAFDTIIGDTPFDTILIDAGLPGMAGIGLFPRLINLGVKIPMYPYLRQFRRSVTRGRRAPTARIRNGLIRVGLPAPFRSPAWQKRN